MLPMIVNIHTSSTHHISHIISYYNSIITVRFYSQIPMINSSVQANLNDPPQPLLPPVTPTYNSPSRILAYIIAYSLSLFYFGYSLALSSYFEYSYHWPRDQQKTFFVIGNAALPIGGLIGGVMYWSKQRHLPRRKTLLILEVVALVVGVLHFIESSKLQMVSKAFQGIVSGISIPIAFRVTHELTILGQHSSFFRHIPIAFISLGMLFPYIISYITEDYIANGVFLGVIIQIGLLASVAREETPMYWLTNNRQDYAQYVIGLLYSPPCHQLVYQTHQKHIQEASRVDALDPPINEQLLGEGHSIEDAKKGAKMRFMVAYAITAMTHLSGPILIIVHFRYFYIFRYRFPQLLFPLMIVAKIIAIFISAKLKDRISRRLLVIVGVLFMLKGLVLIQFSAVIYNWDISSTLVFIGVIILFSFSGLSLQPTVWLYVPTIVSKRRYNIIYLLNWLTCGIVLVGHAIFLVNRDYEDRHQDASFALLSGICGICLICCWLYMVDNKGKSREEVIREYSTQKLCCRS